MIRSVLKNRVWMVFLFLLCTWWVVSDGYTKNFLGGVKGKLLVNSKPQSGAVVFLVPRDLNLIERASSIEVIVQKNKRFVPDFIAVAVGSTVQFENHDQEIHNIHSKTKQNRFDLGAHLPGTVKTVLFKNPGPVLIQCQTHDKMQGIIYVSPSAFYSITDPDGDFEIKNVPLGSYVIGAWHPRLSPKEAQRGGFGLEIYADRKEVTLEFSAEAREGANLMEVTGEDWGMVVDKIAQSLEEVISKWKKGRGRAAMTQIMLIRSKLYIGMGLENAIIQSIGEKKALMYGDKLDEIRKQIQGIEGKNISEITLRLEVQALISDLKNDVKKLSGS